MNVAATLAIGLCPRAASGLLARQPVKLCVEPARGKFLIAGDLLSALPPVTFLRGVRDGLGSGLPLIDVRAVSRFVFLP